MTLGDLVPDDNPYFKDRFCRIKRGFFYFMVLLVMLGLKWEIVLCDLVPKQILRKITRYLSSGRSSGRGVEESVQSAICNQSFWGRV